MSIKSLSSIINDSNINFYFDNKPIKLGEYEKINLNISETIIKNDKKSNLMLYVGDEAMYVPILMHIAITTYISNMLDQDNYIMDSIDIGDKLFVGGKVVVYKSCENIGKDDKRVTVAYMDKKGIKDGTLILPKNSFYKIIPYSGDVKGNKMNTTKGSRSFITKEFIANTLDKEIARKIIDKDVEDRLRVKELLKRFVGIIKNTNVIVLPNKDDIQNLLQRITVKFEEKEYSFTELFPCSYVTSSHNEVDYPGNYSKQEPLFKFTTSVATAYEMVRQDKNIKNVFILDGNCISKEYSDLERIISRKSINKVNIITDYRKLPNISELIDNEETDVYAWTENALLDLSLEEYLSFEDEVFKDQKRSVDSYLNKVYNSELVEDKGIGDLIIDTRKDISKIIKSNIDESHKNLFLMSSYGILNMLETTPFPIQLLEKYIYELGIMVTLPAIAIDNLKSLVRDINADDEIKILEKRVINNLETITDNLYYKNDKWNEIWDKTYKYRSNTYVKRNKDKGIVLVRKQYEAKILSYYFKNRGINVEVQSIDKFTPKDIYDEALLLGGYNLKKSDILNDPHFKKVNFLMYKSEERKYKGLINKDKILKSKIENNNKLYDILEIEPFDGFKDINEPSEYINDSNNTNEEANEIIDIQKYIEDNQFKIDFSKTGYSQNIDAKSTVEIVKMMVSENNEYALFTKQPDVYIIDWEKESLRKRKANDIKEEDYILFINEYLSEESNIVIDIIEKLIEKGLLDEEIKSQYALTRYWKAKLEEYRNENNYTLKDISNFFKMHGENIHYASIRGWISNKRIIGPRNESAYKIISEFVDDTYMKENWKNIYEASSNIRSLHTHMRNKVDKLIRSNFFKKENIEKDSEEIKIIADIIGDTNQYITTAQVHKIYDYNKEVPASISNKLLDMENLY